jgi:hydroxymethylbilane synthase
MKTAIRIGTRGSQLALYQAEVVKVRLQREFPLLNAEVVKIKTSGDMVRRGVTDPMETKRIFTKEIEEALLAGTVDIAVHSAKDLSVRMPAGLKIGAVLEREDPRDCLVSKDHKKISELPLGARIGTSALRRKMQLLRWSPELIIEELHGNVDSRIKRIEEGEYDAIVLAYAGIKRLGLVNYVTEIFPEEKFYPAPGQGAIAIQSRLGDFDTDEMLEPIHHKPSAVRLECERAFLRKLEGGCQLPCGISTSLKEGVLYTKGALFAIDSHEWAEQVLDGPADHPEDVGETLADLVLQNGGQPILDKIRRDSHDKKHDHEKHEKK